MISPEQVKEKTIERFWSKIKFGEPNECWEWQRSVDGRGYGQFQIGTLKNPKKVNSHRYVFQCVFGKLPSRKILACHTCDNPKCCNPNHLFPGTQKDNMHDAKIKGRISTTSKSCGEANPRSKIKDSDVRVIRKRLAAGETLTAVGSDYGLKTSATWAIKTRFCWKHVK